MSQYVKLSRTIALLLRHHPEYFDLSLDRQGWCSVDALLAAMNARGKYIDMEILRLIVATDDKGRYAFNEDQTFIRALQGHSVYVDLELKPVTPPAVLYHGTVEKFLDLILSEGLKKNGRNHVHLSADVKTADKVGSRRGLPVILVVDASRMVEDGILFYRSENGVWLCDYVPADYLSLSE
jgi:putative RNA 2'-phosphotransferase